MKKALYPGTFDPLTYGHLDIISRAAQLFDELIIAVTQNRHKSSLFSLEERLELIQKVCHAHPNVTVESFNGLLVDYAKTHNARVIVRGLRAVADFEYEFQLARMNQALYGDLETVFLIPCEEYGFVSSTLVREIASLKGDVSQFVPSDIARALQKKFQE